jgi:hypothetical protein
MKITRWHEMEVPAEPMPRGVFDRMMEMFREKVPEDAMVEVIAYMSEGDPPYFPNQKHLKFRAEWPEEFE